MEGYEEDDVLQKATKFMSETDANIMKRRQFSAMWGVNRFPTLGVFEVHNQHHCCLLRITVVSGRNITMGWIQDYIDTPDPYVSLVLDGTPNGKKVTKTVDNCTNPIWNQDFTFYFDQTKNHNLEVTLTDANYTRDMVIGKETMDIKVIPFDQKIEKVITFKNGSEILLKMLITKSEQPDLRLGMGLCDEEKSFLRARRARVFEAMQKILPGEKRPKSLHEVPCVAVLGSGGGYRAMVGLAGAFKAFQETEILDCLFYVAGLSGSTWYISLLYSHPHFPDELRPVDLLPELKEKTKENLFRNLSLSTLYSYCDTISLKNARGQPVSLTDFYGYLLRDSLLYDRNDTKLTDQRKVVEDGKVPLPLYTCLHVKNNVSSLVFQEWLEFSPYEIGISKYGAFMQPDLFNSRFYMGRLVRLYEEPPLYFLQALWGNAFTIHFPRLLKQEEENRKEKNKKVSSKTEPKKEISAKEQEEKLASEKNKTEDTNDEKYGETKNTKERNGKAHYTEEREVGRHLEWELQKSTAENAEEVDMRSPAQDNHTDDEEDEKKLPRKASIRQKKRESKVDHHKMVVYSLLEKVANTSLMSSRSHRAGHILNFLRGLWLSRTTGTPETKTAPQDETDNFKGRLEPLDTEEPDLLMVDSGLSFNCPFPVLLRPQRGLDVILSFDYSQREKDDDCPFKELLLAEQWAKLNSIPFPPVAKKVKELMKEPLRECYVFKNEKNLHCPVVLHFVLINRKFKESRQNTKEEREFSDFSVFDDVKKPYSTFKLYYSTLEFERLVQLCEFNTRDSLPLILEEIGNAVKRKQLLSIGNK